MSGGKRSKQIGRHQQVGGIIIGLPLNAGTALAETPDLTRPADRRPAAMMLPVATMADTGHYRIDSTTVRAHVSAAGGKVGLIDALLVARGAGSPVSFTAWLMPYGDR